MKAITYYPVISKTRHSNALDCYERNLAFKKRLVQTLLGHILHNNKNCLSRLFHVSKTQVRDKLVDLQQQESGGWVY